MNDNIQELYTDKIILPTIQMRNDIDRDELHDLATDIKKNGLISPITVRPIDRQTRDGVVYRIPLQAGDTAGSDMCYELVAGQRRYLAHQIAGILKIKCVVRYLTDDEALGIMTSENLARAEVNPVDEANHVGRLMQLHDGDLAKVAHIVSRGEQWVKDRLAISTMPENMQEHLRHGRLKLGVALSLVQITEEPIRDLWVELAVRDGVSVAQARYWVDGWKLNQVSGTPTDSTPQSGFDGQGRNIVMFECAVDGKKYDARQFKSVMIHESNYPMFMSVCAELRNLPADTDSGTGAN